MTAFSKTKQIKLAYDNEAADRFVLAHVGECPLKIASVYKAAHPEAGPVVVVFTTDIAPRPAFCSSGSVQAALGIVLPIIKATTDEAERRAKALFWVRLAENLCTASGGELQALAGVR
jgi:hypothetical protein